MKKFSSILKQLSYIACKNCIKYEGNVDNNQIMLIIFQIYNL